MADDPMVSVHFIHGLEGSPRGTKARVLAQHFDCETPAMDTSDFPGCVRLHARRLAERAPGVLVGSSFGAAVAVALLQAGDWRGPTLLLAQAAVLRGLPVALPAAVPVWLVHGLRDTVVPPEHSRQLAQAGAEAGGDVRLIEVDDDHALHASTADGRLVAWVRELAGAP